MQVEINHQTLALHQGDITLEQVDAIVNAANSQLAGGGGVDGAIHRRGGPDIMAETRSKYPDGCPTGSAVISGGGDLAAKYVIHAVGPVWHGGGKNEDALLAGCYSTALDLAAEHRLASIAFPAISTGVYHFPPDRAARVAVGTVASEIAAHPRGIKHVVFCCFSAASAEHHKMAFAELGLV
jgi:O-acetyl-ADP-ribose deacetylase (regulator of RNase III)